MNSLGGIKEISTIFKHVLFINLLFDLNLSQAVRTRHDAHYLTDNGAYRIQSYVGSSGEQDTFSSNTSYFASKDT